MSYKCCEGVRGLKFSRRYFLKQGGVAMVGLSAMPAFLQRAVAATPMPNRKQLVVLFQRGAADGLNIVVPFGESNYYRMRPTIAFAALLYRASALQAEIKKSCSTVCLMLCTTKTRLTG